MMSVTAENGGGAAAGIEMVNLSLDVGQEPTISRQTSRAGTRGSLLELHVCLPDLSHVTIMIDQHTQATEIMDTIIESLRIAPAEARRLLSLWLVSADLELQLKPNHCPVQLFGKWPVYLRKYTSLSERAWLAQKPLVHLRRNVYISREEDLRVTDLEILELLFTEARCNVINGTYPCSRDLVISLAGILCAMQYGPYDETQHTPEFYKDRQASILPVAMLADTKPLIQQLIQSLANKTNSFLNLRSTEDLRLTFLSACSESLAYYGSVFFDGYIQRVSKSFLHSSWLSVSIGANTDGIYIISAENQEPLLGILYENLTWEYVEVCSCTTADCPHNKGEADEKHQPRVSRKVKTSKKDKVTSMPCLLLQYPATPDEQSEGVNFQVVKVFTKSARLINAFIENCSDILKQRIHSSPMPSPEVMSAGDAVDGPRFTSKAGLAHGESLRTRESLERSIKGLLKPNKLICQSFTKDGKCVSV